MVCKLDKNCPLKESSHNSKLQMSASMAKTRSANLPENTALNVNQQKEFNQKVKELKSKVIVFKYSSDLDNRKQ